MLTLRSYPYGQYPGRSFVQDAHTKRFYQSNYDYTGLAKFEEDIVLLEWDIAAGKEAIEYFEEAARAWPADVRVAPHKLYHIGPEPVWAHRKYDPMGLVEDEDEDGTPTRRALETERWIRWLEPTADLFAFGMVYLPYEMIRAFEDAPAPERGRPAHVEPGRYEDTRFCDQTFSMWHFRHINEPVFVDWNCVVAHLHW